MDKIYIIDASGYLFSSYFAIRNMTNGKGESTNALFGFIRSVLKLIKDFNPKHLVAVFDGPNNAKKRKDLYAEYKAHRSEAPRDLPYQIEWAQKFCQLYGIPLLSIPDVEADDTMGSIAIWQEHHTKAISYLCTSDKDMCQLVNDRVFLLNTRKDNLLIGAKEVEEIHGVRPDQMIDLLAMTGDASDNVPGLPGIGPKTAATLLKQFGTLDNLFANVNQIEAEKRRKVIVDNKDLGLLSRQLVTIDLHVEVPHDEAFYQLKAPNVTDLKAFYQQMNFFSLIKELEHAAPQAAPQVVAAPAKSVQTSAAQLELFSTEELHQAQDGVHTLVDDDEALAKLVAYLREHKEICFDTEATDYLPLRAELVGIGFAVKPKEAWYVPVNGKLGLEKVINAFKPLFENPSFAFYGHNVKFDYHLLHNYGIEIANICFDTILASYVLNSHDRRHSLDILVQHYFGKTMIEYDDLVGKGKKAVTMREVPIDKVCTYCCDDADYTCRLKKMFEQLLKERKLEKVFYDIELPLVKVLALMEEKGIYLDVGKLEAMAIDLQGKLKTLQQEIFALAGEEFNLNSPKQLSEVLQNKLQIPLPKKTATGLSTNADVLESLKEKYPIANFLLDYRGLEKLRSTYVDSLPHDVNPKTHRIHCSFKQSVAATGRLSCQDPNLQNIPVRTEEGRKIREAFKPQKEGWSYLAADYSQIELRLLAHFCGDEKLIHAFKHGEDIHRYTAATVFGIPLDQVTREQRYQAKAVNFGIIYGQQAFGLAQELKISQKEAAAFIATYFERYPKVKEYIEKCKEEARRTGKSVTLTGRERLIPEIHSKNGQIRQFAERLAVNTPLQGTSADIIKFSMIKMDKLLKEQQLESSMILQIHDELLFEVPDSEIEILAPQIKEVMEHVVELNVPLVVDICIGKNWKEC